MQTGSLGLALCRIHLRLTDPLLRYHRALFIERTIVEVLLSSEVRIPARRNASEPPSPVDAPLQISVPLTTRLEVAPMKRKIALMITVIGVAAAVVPVADAKPSAPSGGGSGGGVCICLPPVSIQ
jgi:hypothetical protein